MPFRMHRKVVGRRWLKMSGLRWIDKALGVWIVCGALVE